MGHYGPPGGPSRGGPWPGHPRGEAYGRAADAWGATESAAAYGDPRPGADSPGHGGDARPSAAPGRDPTPAGPTAPTDGSPPRKQRPVNWLTVLAIAVPLLAIAGAGTLIYLLNGAEAPAGAKSASVAAGAGATPTASAQASVPQVGSSDARFVKTGECLQNEGEATRPKLSIAPCAPKTFEVLARFDGRTDGEADAKLKCGTVPGYTNWYYFKSELDVLDYVLCLKLR